MVKHIVFFKLLHNAPDIQNEIKKQLLSLQKNISNVVAIEVGINFANEERAYDMALLADFETKEDLKAYAAHPYHLEVINYLKSVTIDTKVVDYKY